MDPELKVGFDKLQAQVIETRSKIAGIEYYQKKADLDSKVNDSIIEELFDDADIESKFLYQPVGRMLVKLEGKQAHEFLLARQKQYQDKLQHYKEVKEVCLNRVKESENSLRELVNKKLNKTDRPAVKQEKGEVEEQVAHSTEKDEKEGDSKKN